MAHQIKDYILPDGTPVGEVSIQGGVQIPLQPDSTPRGEVPIQPPVEKPERKPPSWGRAAWESFKDMYGPITIGRAAYNQGRKLFRETGVVPEGWESITVEAIDGHHRDDFGLIFSARSPVEQDIIKQEVTEDRAEREWIRQGHWSATLAGGGVGFGAPGSLIKALDVVGMFKSLSKTESFIKNIIHAAPGVTAASAAANAAIVASHDSMHMDEWAINTATDAVLGSVLFGAMSLPKVMELQSRVKAASKIYDKADFVMKKNKKGELVNILAVSKEPHGSAGAAAVGYLEQAQFEIDHGMQWLRKDSFFGKIFKLSPVVKMMNSPFKMVQLFGHTMFRPSGILKFRSWMESAAEQGFNVQSAEQIMVGLMGGAYNSVRAVNSAWEKYIGINSNLPLKDTIGAIKNKLEKEKLLSRKQFSEEVGKAFRRGDKHTIPEVAEAAEFVRKYYDKLKQYGIDLEKLAPDVDPITAISYLNRIYDKVKMTADPDGFVEAVVKDLMEQSQKLQELHAPIQKLRGELDRLKIAHDLREKKNEIEGKKGVKYKNKKEYIKKRKEIKERIQKEKDLIQAKAEAGEIEPILIADRPAFTTAERKELEELHETFNKKLEVHVKAIESAKNKIQELRNELRLEREKVAQQREPYSQELAKQGEVLGQTKSNRSVLRDQINIHKEEIASAKEEIKDLQNDIDVTKAEIKMERKETAEVSKSETAERKQTIDNHKKTIESLNEQIQGVKSHLRQTKQDISNSDKPYQEKLDLKAEETKKSEAQLKKLKRNINQERKAILAQEKKNVREKHRDEKEIRAERVKQEEKIKDLRAKIKEKKAEISATRKSIKAAREKFKTYPEVLKEQSGKVAAARMPYKEQLKLESERITAIKEEIKTLKAELRKKREDLKTQRMLNYEELENMIEKGEMKAEEYAANRKEWQDTIENEYYQTERWDDIRAGAKKMLDMMPEQQPRKVNKKFYYETAPRLPYRRKGYKLIDPNDQRTYLRTPITEDEAWIIARKSRDKILNQNQEQMMSQAFDDLRGGEGWSPFKARTLRVRDETVEPWLINDINQLVMMYGGLMSRTIAYEKSMRSILGKEFTTSEEAEEFLIHNLEKDFLIKLNKLTEHPKSKARTKQLKRLKEALDEGINLIKKGNRAFWGNYSKDRYSDSQKSFLSALRDWTASVALGALPLLQLGEIGAIIREFGMGAFLDNLHTMMHGMLEGNAKYAQDDLAHVGIAINSVLASYSDALYGHGGDYHPRGWFSRAFAAAADKMGNITMSNQLDDAMQHLVGVATQSKIIRTLEKFAGGEKLSQKELEFLQLVGMDQHKWAKRILDQANKYGSYKEFKTGKKAWVANYADWEDFDAAQTLLNSIKQKVDSTILRANIADTPFAFKDDVVKTITMFLGYSFAATNHRLLNVIQRPDAEKVLGELIAMTLGSFVSPIRQILDGEEPDLSPKALMLSAVFNGSPGGIFIDGINRANGMLNIPFLNQLNSGGRFGHKGGLKLGLGAVGSFLDNLINVGQMGLNAASGGTPSEGDIKRAIKMFPFTHAWEFRRPVNALVDSWDFPSRRRTADLLLSQ